VLAAAELKVRAALPPALARQLGVTAERFHLDATGWYARTADTPFLPAVAGAVWRGSVLQVRYRRWKEPTDVDRRLEPYGLVLKAGRWYLVAGPGPRTYRVDQILDLAVTDDHCVIPDGFSLAAYWRSNAADFLASLHQADAVVRLSPAAAARQTALAAAALAATGVTEPDGWIRAVLPIESTELATSSFLSPDIEVLEPADLRASVAATARAITAIYQPSETNAVLPACRRLREQVDLRPRRLPDRPHRQTRNSGPPKTSSPKVIARKDWIAQPLLLVSQLPLADGRVADAARLVAGRPGLAR
jgi:predicted DNA-binding transcriptional regulator YafY